MPVALQGMYFAQGNASARIGIQALMGGQEQPVPLGKVPPVLLSEVWSDLRAAAQDGSGYDAEWTAKIM